MTTTARDQILADIRANQPAPMPLPGAFVYPMTYPDLAAQFAAVLQSVGGVAVPVADFAAIGTYLSQHFATATGVATTLPQLAHLTDVDLAQITDPHDLAGLHLAILGGQLGVAENAAIWVDERHLPPALRVLPMIAQYLALVISRADLVADMHQAYGCLDVAATGFGTFIAGPSKTADIEQSLVIGAHGARGLTVFLLP